MKTMTSVVALVKINLVAEPVMIQLMVVLVMMIFKAMLVIIC